MDLQTKLVVRCEAFEGILKAQFDTSVNKTLTTGIKDTFVEGCTYGVVSGLIYSVESLLFFIGAVLISHGLYTYLQMVEEFGCVFGYY